MSPQKIPNAVLFQMAFDEMLKLHPRVLAMYFAHPHPACRAAAAEVAAYRGLFVFEKAIHRLRSDPKPFVQRHAAIAAKQLETLRKLK